MEMVKEKSLRQILSLLKSIAESPYSTTLQDVIDSIDAKNVGCGGTLYKVRGLLETIKTSSMPVTMLNHAISDLESRLSTLK